MWERIVLTVLTLLVMGGLMAVVHYGKTDGYICLVGAYFWGTVMGSASERGM